MKQVLELTSVTAAFVSGLILYGASFGIQWEKQTWGGATPYEMRVKRRNKVLGVIGVSCAFLAFGIQVVVIIRFGS